MFIWTGYGFFAFLFFGMGICVGTIFDVALRAASIDIGLGSIVANALAAVAIWKVGNKVNAPVNGFHPATGQPVVYSNRHTFFWIPLQYWAFGPALLLGLGILGLIAGLFV